MRGRGGGGRRDAVAVGRRRARANRCRRQVAARAYTCNTYRVISRVHRTIRFADRCAGARSKLFFFLSPYPPLTLPLLSLAPYSLPVVSLSVASDRLRVSLVHGLPGPLKTGRAHSPTVTFPVRPTGTKPAPERSAAAVAVIGSSRGGDGIEERISHHVRTYVRRIRANVRRVFFASAGASCILRPPIVIRFPRSSD